MKSRLLTMFFFLLTIGVLAEIHTVTQSGLSFFPSTLTVHVGDTVRWVWSAGVHTTTSTAVPAGAVSWDSPLTPSTPSFSYRVTTPGNYSYRCTPHASSDMTGNFTAVVATGSPDLIKGSLLHLYPNPASNNLTIDLPENGNILIHDLLGRIAEASANLLSNNQLSLDVSSLKPGIYLAVFTPVDNRLKLTRKFIKR